MRVNRVEVGVVPITSCMRVGGVGMWRRYHTFTHLCMFEDAGHHIGVRVGFDYLC